MRIAFLSEQQYWLGFSLIPEIGTKRILKLLHHFGSLASAWKASEGALRQAGLEARLVERLLAQRKTLDTARELARVEKVRAWLLILDDARYPAALKAIADPPAVLYVRGTLRPEDERALCIVGTRKATLNGRETAQQIAQELARNGLTIVSGLAQGIDEAAHRGALLGGGRTIAISACGINSIYPPQNLELAHEIIERGAVVTEFPLNTPPRPHNFPQRNRIMSGLALGVLVAEAPAKSGALITASIAAEQGREVFALPGSIQNAASSGTNRLIQEGAKLVMTVGDILGELNIAHSAVQAKAAVENVGADSEIEAQVLQWLYPEPVHIDEIVRNSGLPVSVVSSTLTLLELKGLAQMVGAMQYCLVVRRA
ncbi:MAG: DNA-protecting protein DprA [Chloroflexi bacterium]|nr:DNA-protecting protein DprA [Chloroflexota bacterium]